MLSLGRRLPLSGSGCLPAAWLSLVGDGLVRSQLAFLWYWLSPLFCKQAQQCLRLELFVGKFSLSLFSSLSLAIPLFGLLSHVSSLRLSSGHSGSVTTLSNAARASLFSPCLLVADASVWATSRLKVAIRHVICGFLFIYLLILLVMLPSETPKRPADEPVRGFPGVWKLSFMTPFPGWDSIPNSFVFLFILYILSYLLSKTVGCLSGCLVSSASVHKLFCEICSEFKWSFDEFWGESGLPILFLHHLKTTPSYKN